jgi:HD-GYP domain-containing protein (c-di-GMP phosphodiesterase class II)
MSSISYIARVQDRAEVRLAELVAVLSLVSDLGMGRPMEHAMRQCRIAMGLGERLGLDDQAREAIYYSGLLAWVGCHVDAYEQAKWFGDDHAMKSDSTRVDFGSARAGMGFVVRHLGAGQPFAARVRAGLGFFAGGGAKDLEVMLQNHWRAVESLAISLGLDEPVRTSIKQCFERWDGKGAPDGAKGEEILLTSRLVCLADVAEIYHQGGGVDAAVEVARARSGTQFDPEVVELFCDCAPSLFDDLEQGPSWDAVVAAAPGLGEPLAAEALDGALEGIADFTDVKSPYTIGHSRGVADLAADAADTVGLTATAVTDVRRAGLLHDLGRIGVSNGVWDKEGALTVSETERVRVHPYLTERTLASSPGLAHLGAIAIQHHERLDGSGYPRGLSGDAITPGGRVLAAADMYRAKVEPRPHRPAVSPPDAATIVRDEVRAGRLDGDAVDAVLRAAGHRVRRRRDTVAGLTPREVEVLRLLARGMSNKQIAGALEISRKTAGNHVEHIYAKLGVTNRALASLFAAKHGLMD